MDYGNLDRNLDGGREGTTVSNDQLVLRVVRGQIPVTLVVGDGKETLPELDGLHARNEDYK